MLPIHVRVKNVLTYDVNMIDGPYELFTWFCALGFDLRCLIHGIVVN